MYHKKSWIAFLPFLHQAQAISIKFPYGLQTSIINLIVKSVLRDS